MTYVPCNSTIIISLTNSEIQSEFNRSQEYRKNMVLALESTTRSAIVMAMANLAIGHMAIVSYMLNGNTEIDLYVT